MRNWITLIESEVIDNDTDSDYEARQDAEDTRVRNMERKILAMCANEFGWEFDGVSYPVSYDASENELTITVADSEVTLDQLQKLTSLGDHIAISASNGYRIVMTIKTHPGLNLA
jgi:hypothetical protein